MPLHKIIAVGAFGAMYAFQCYIDYKKRREVEWIPNALAPAVVAWALNSVLAS